MKTLRNSILAILTIFAAVSCTDEIEDRPVVAAGEAPVLTAPEEGNVYVLNPDNMDVLAERFIWSPANLGAGIIPNYDLEITTEADINFETPAIVGTTNGTTQLAASHSLLNAALLRLNATPFVSANFMVRVKASVGSVTMYSNAVEMIITPYTTETPRLWVNGAFQEGSGYGTDFTTAPQLMSTTYGDPNFEGYIYIADASNGFKLSTQADANGVNYGMGSEAGKLSATGGAITAAPGYYLFKVNTATLDYTLTPASWGIIGNSTPGGWDNSTPMTYDSTTKKWTVTAAMIPQTAPDNGWKFRANNAWDLNLGDTVTNQTDGTLVYSGSNIGIASAGTYKITLDLSNPRAYTYTIERQ
jgi:hypothetical protein